MKKGYSLIEVLVVISVLVLLAGLLYPVLSRSVRQGYHASDIGQMRQIAIAGCLYSSEVGTFPLRIEQLVSAKMLDPKICKLSLDPCPEGFGNYFLKNIVRLKYLEKTVSPYPQSFLCMGHFGYRDLDMRESLSLQNPGWAVSILPVGRLRSLEMWGTRYQRVQDDGSVVTYNVPSQQSGTAILLHFRNFFADHFR